MLDFSLTSDEKPMHTRGLAYAGSIEYEEFERAQELKIIGIHLDYYGKFRWLTQNVQQKCALLTPASVATVPTLAAVLNLALAANCGLVAFGD